MRKVLGPRTLTASTADEHRRRPPRPGLTPVRTREP